MILIPKESECGESPHSDQETGIRFRGFRFLNWVEGGFEQSNGLPHCVR